MRTLLVAFCLTAACGGALVESAQQDDLISCHGLKSAHCFCRVETGQEMSTGGAFIDKHLEGAELFTYVIPDKCYNQQLDYGSYHFDSGCWKDCRDAFGVEGHPQAAEVARLKGEAGKTLRAEGYCGGWNSAPLRFAAGTNKYRDATAVGIGIGVGGTVVTQGGQQVCK